MNLKRNKIKFAQPSQESINVTFPITSTKVLMSKKSPNFVLEHLLKQSVPPESIAGKLLFEC